MSLTDAPARPRGAHLALCAARDGRGAVWKYRVPPFISVDADKVDAMRRDSIQRRELAPWIDRVLRHAEVSSDGEHL